MFAVGVREHVSIQYVRPKRCSLLLRARSLFVAPTCCCSWRSTARLSRAAREVAQLAAIASGRQSRRPRTRQGPRRAAARQAGGRIRAPKPVGAGTRRHTRRRSTPMRSPEAPAALGLTVARDRRRPSRSIDQQTMQEQGFRTTTEAAQGAVGVTAGDAPAAPAGFLDARLHRQPDQHALQRHQIGPRHDSRIMDTGQSRADRDS